MNLIKIICDIFQDQADGINIYNWLNKQETPNMATTPIARTSTPTTNIAYRPVYKHWFYKITRESKRVWIPFSFSDSMLLEEAFVNKGLLFSIHFKAIYLNS